MPQFNCEHPLPLRLCQVTPDDDLGELVQTQEVRTGRSGRLFLILGAERLPYQVHSLPVGAHLGLRIDRLDAQGRPLHSQCLTRAALPRHALGEAQATGQLFTPSLP